MKTTQVSTGSRWLPTALAYAITSAALAAQPAVYDGFSDYAIGSNPLNQSGGQGFASVWGAESALGLPGANGGVPVMAPMEILAESLAYSDGVRSLLTTGGSMHLSGINGTINLGRELDPEALPHSGDEPWMGRETYISFLFHRGGEPADPQDPSYNGNYPWGDNLYPRTASLKLVGRDGRQMRFGNLSNTQDNVWRVTGEDLYGTEGKRDARSSTQFGGRTTFVVIRIRHGGGGWQADRFNVWFNPVLAAEDMNVPPLEFDWTIRDNPHHIAPDWIGLTVGDGSGNRPYVDVTIDEFRLGTSWEEVTPHTDGEFWGDFPVTKSGYVYTGGRYLGWVAPSTVPGWNYSWALQDWIYHPYDAVPASGGWFYLQDLFGPGELEAPQVAPDLIAYEGFDYNLESSPSLATGTLAGGSGWAGPWDSININPMAIAPVEPDSLAYSDSLGRVLQTSGHHARVSGIPASVVGNLIGAKTDVRRALATPPDRSAGSKIYLSFVGQRVGDPTNPSDPVWQNTTNYPDGYPFGDNLYPRGAGIELMPDVESSSASALFGARSDRTYNRWSLVSSSTTIVNQREFTESAFIVARIDYTQHVRPNLTGELVERTGSRITLWINPTDLEFENHVDAYQTTLLLDEVDPYDLAFSAISIAGLDASYNRPVSQFRFDEIRFGNSWSAVTPFVGQPADRKDPRDPNLPLEWAGLHVSETGYVFAGDRLGHIYIGASPWLYSSKLQSWVYLPEDTLSAGGGWTHIYSSAP